VHKNFKAEEEQGPQKKDPKTPPNFETPFPYNPSFEERYSKPKKKTKNRQNFRRISTKVFFQRNKRLMAAAPPPPPSTRDTDLLDD
jgi:hypothetical protein